METASDRAAGVAQYNFPYGSQVLPVESDEIEVAGAV